MTQSKIKPLRIAFMGTPDFAVSALQALLDSANEVVCVYTQPPRPKGRGKKVQSSPVHQLAQAHNIEVRYPQNFKNSDDVENFKNLNLDVAVVAAYGLILPKDILDAPRHGCINIHGSLLPRWRGAAPIHRAILAGDTQTGITLMQMDEGLDTGDMISKGTVDITDTSTLSELHDVLAEMGGQMLIPCLDDLSLNGALETTPQSDDGACYAHMLKKQEGHIDWNKSAEEIDRMVRGFNPWPGTYSFTEGKRIKILEAQFSDIKTSMDAGVVLDNGCVSCGNKSVLKLIRIQPENKKPMDIKAALNGEFIKEGLIFS